MEQNKDTSLTKVGILGYGVYIPKYRISVNEIANTWSDDGPLMSKSINVTEKAVPALDEDTITISVMAVRNSLLRANISPVDIGAIYVGSESHPYAVKPSAVTVAEAIGATPVMTASDLEFACKAGTAGMQMCFGLAKSDEIKYGIAIGTDTAQGRPGDQLEYTAGAGGCAFVLGKGKLIAELEGMYSYTSDTPDFWRREGATYPSHAGRFTGEPSYFKHTLSAAQGLMQKIGIKASDVDRLSLHQPNGRFPISAAKKLGIPYEKLEDALCVVKVGNTYSAASMIGLARHLDKAKPGERIMCVSYGSGAGSDAFSFVVTDEIEEVRNNAPDTDYYINKKEMLNYAIYAKHRRKIKMD
ncbi:MAG: hydroxymethylglutaryl-CoA synthase [Candidatus Heimdallarchaeota archaeon]|nr:hydroxymethylglutaryl-CoA synthase [Candidatus Heimdallarchaeota archaeon]MDH5644428.1 hydroxymethylglutaryl-CoA synthase [Candidatus Heimdallarchaeota archaeon]